MTLPLKAPARATAPPQDALPVGPWPTPPWTLEQHLQRIEAMGLRIQGYIRFICQVDSLDGTSAEAKARAVAAFYERLVAAEGQLSRIQDELRLG